MYAKVKRVYAVAKPSTPQERHEERAQAAVYMQTDIVSSCESR